MNCCWITDRDTESVCGSAASPFMCMPVCDEHIDALRELVSIRTRATALEAAKHHPLDTFPGFCYIILLPDGNVKIGFSTTEKNLKLRFKHLSEGYKAPVIKLAVIEGGFVAESVLHERFKEYRLPGLGERFTYSPEMAEYISSL